MDYIIIKKNGNPLTFGSITIPDYKDERDTIIVYGDKDEAENDFSEDEDLGIAELEYENRISNCIVKVKFNGKEIGEFTHIFEDEGDFQSKLWDFITIFDFVAYQLPH